MTNAESFRAASFRRAKPILLGAGLFIRWRSSDRHPRPQLSQESARAPGSGTGTSRSSSRDCQATSWNALTLASSVADPVDVDQDVSWSAEYLVVPVRRRINHEPRILYPTNELAHRDLSLQPR
jgi:hypothetical protein